MMGSSFRGPPATLFGEEESRKVQTRGNRPDSSAGKKKRGRGGAFLWGKKGAFYPNPIRRKEEDRKSSKPSPSILKGERPRWSHQFRREKSCVREGRGRWGPRSREKKRERERLRRGGRHKALTTGLFREGRGGDGCTASTDRGPP